MTLHSEVGINLAQASDNQLVRLARARDEAAFNELLARHDGRAFQVALNMFRDCYDDASDAMQDARLACWESLVNALIENFGPWYLGVVRHCCNRLYKQRQRRADWMDVDTIAETIPGSIDALIGLEERSYLHGAVDALPPLQAQTVRLYYLNGYGYAEIALILDCAESTVRNSVRKGLKNLRERLGNVGAIGA